MILIRIISILFSLFFISCSKNNIYPKKVYMPDMYYSEAYEPYSKILEKNMINKSSIYPLIKSSGSASFYPVKNTISRNKKIYFDINNIKNNNNNINNSLRGKKMYLIHCSICHGEHGDGQGFLVKKEKILGVPNYKNTSVTNINDVIKIIKYGKNNMGSYSSQLSESDMLEVAKYILFLKKNNSNEN